MAVLVAVSIPIFTRQLEKSRESTDLANLRAAKAAAVTAILDGGQEDDSVESDLIAGTPVYYDPISGVLVKTADEATGGKGTDLRITGINYKNDQPYKEYSYDGKSVTEKKIQLQYTAAKDKLVVKFAA